MKVSKKKKNTVWNQSAVPTGVSSDRTEFAIKWTFSPSRRRRLNCQNACSVQSGERVERSSRAAARAAVGSECAFGK